MKTPSDECNGDIAGDVSENKSVTSACHDSGLAGSIRSGGGAWRSGSSSARLHRPPLAEALSDTEASF